MSWNDEWSKQVHDEVEAGAKNESSEDFSGAKNAQQKNPDENGPVSGSSEPREIKRFKEWFLKAQKAGFVLGLFALVFMPLIPSEHYRVAILGFVMVLGLRLSVVYQSGVNAFQCIVNTRLTTLGDQLSVLALRTEAHESLTYDDFARCSPAISEACAKLLENGQDLSLDLLVVAAFHSWPFFEARLPEWGRSFPQRKIAFNIAMVCPGTLREWGADLWAQRSESTASVINLFAKEMKKGCTNLTIKVTFYDQIPFLHGILINNSLLFRGKTEWVHSQVPNGFLEVGNHPYERFSVDKPDERSKVKTFRSWIRQVGIRHRQLMSKQAGGPPSPPPDGGAGAPSF